MTPEQKLTKEIQLWCGQNNIIMIREQSGVFYDRQGNLIRCGFPGLSDYIVITPEGKIAFIELKVKPNKPTKEQLHFIERMHQRNVIASVVYSVEDLKKSLSKTI